MINKKELFIGAISGLVAPPVAFVLWVYMFTNYSLIEAMDLIQMGGLYSEVLSLSAIANMFIMYFFLNRNRNVAARGVLMATLFLAVLVLAGKLLK